MATVEDGDDEGDLIADPALLPDGAAHPPTPEAQASSVEALREVLAGVPGGLGSGFLAREPGWLPGVRWQPGKGNPDDDPTLVDHDGVALPALGALRER